MSYYPKLNIEKNEKHSVENSKLKKFESELLNQSDDNYISGYIKAKMNKNWLNRALKFSRSGQNRLFN